MSVSKQDIRIGLYQHFKGRYYYVTQLVLNTVTNSWDVLYHDLNYPERVYTRPLEDFLAKVDDKGISISEREDNTTGQSVRFNKINNIEFAFKDVETEVLVKELRMRADSPLQDLDIEGMNDKVTAIDYVVGRKVYGPDSFLVPLGVDIYAGFETKEKAEQYFYNHRRSRDTAVFKRVFIEQEL